MSSLLRSGSSGRRLFGSRFHVLTITAAMTAGGCSADIARFDFPASAAFNDTTGTIPPASGLGADTSMPPPAPSAEVAPLPGTAKTIEFATLPPPTAEPAPVARGAYVPTAVTPPPAAAPYAPAAYTPAPVAAEVRGEDIEVKRGDTLYGLSKRHGVSLNELMRVNGLTTPELKPGQRLSLPSGKVAARPRAPAVAAAPPVPAPADWTGSYTIKPGDSLYAVARQNKVKLDDLQRYNGITDVRRVKPGTVLKVPGLAGAVLAETPASPATPRELTPPPVPPVTIATPAPGSMPTAPSATPKILNSGAEKKVVALDEATVTAVTAPAAGSVASGKLRWPAQGRIIAGYGPRSDGTHNDGINISLPMGADIHAAENGKVAYAGSELKGYGNLILVRHENSGLVTAYAHANELLVKRGDVVTRGQVIAKAGKTGAVDQPQLHFEVRRDQTPVDPTGYLEKP
jgi:murein DD-endopeptidase MepM/ murein hydrolase activator NlpD